VSTIHGVYSDARPSYNLYIARLSSQQITLILTHNLVASTYQFRQFRLALIIIIFGPILLCGSIRSSSELLDARRSYSVWIVM